MERPERTITIVLVYLDERPVVKLCHNQYFSLMTLITTQFGIPGFGLCCGMGSCGTCRVDLMDKYSNSTTSVLSCDTLINDSPVNTKIYLSGQLY